MRARWICLGLLLPLTLPLSPGCGSAPDDAGDRLVVVSMKPTEGDGFVFNGVEVVTTDDGCPGVDDSAGNGFWDGCTDEEYEPMTVDYVDIVLRNELRPGVDDGRPLEVYRVRVTFYDAAGDTPSYAPTLVADGPLTIDPGGEGTLTMPVDTMNMKYAIRELFWTDQVTGQVGLTAVIDIYAVDVLNDEEVHAQTRVGIGFVNPN